MKDALAQARIVEDQITAMIPKISAHRFSGEDVKAIMIGLIDDGLNGQYTDYQGAEQAAMAMQSVAEFMGRHKMLNTQSVRAPMKTPARATSSPADWKKSAA